MYREAELSQYVYFQNLLAENIQESYILDPLTGLVSRQHILGFIHSLISEKQTFTLIILDLDNFKEINDTYGHSTGDAVLREVSGSLTRFLGNRGIAGRFGGDEFLILFLGENDYDTVHDFCSDLYNSPEGVVRRRIKDSPLHPFITATLGCASYPRDAADYHSLFTLVDKTLYRGKAKGRNCFIIYVEEKHKNIQVSELANRHLFPFFQKMIDALVPQEPFSPLMDRLRELLPVLKEQMRLSDCFLINLEDELWDIEENRMIGKVPDAQNILSRCAQPGEELYASSYDQPIEAASPELSAVFAPLEIEAVMMVRIRHKDQTYGYLLFAARRIIRLWQDDEKAGMLFLAHLIGDYLYETEQNESGD